jgi:hypothetical protein
MSFGYTVTVAVSMSTAVVLNIAAVFGTVNDVSLSTSSFKAQVIVGSVMTLKTPTL